MSFQSQRKIIRTIKHYCLGTMALLVISNLTAGGFIYASLLNITEEVTVHNIVTPVEAKVTMKEPEIEHSIPLKIDIPKIELSTTFVPPLQLNPNQTISVPDNYTEVGWYEGGVTPGEVGSAVVLGHVDSYQGPAVFYRLGRLKPDDEITITRQDSSVVVFIVEKLERYDQDQFPTELVYGPVDYPGLRLITCSGVFNRSEQRYSHNLVVFARLK